MSSKGLSMRPSSSIKTRFAYGFLRALKRLSQPKPTSPSSPREIYRRYRMIKLTADASMASAVGPRRAWSRAVLQKVRLQAQTPRTRALVRKRIRRRSRTRSRIPAIVKRRSISRANEARRRTEELRNLVPGGEGMDDVCSLLDETAHYIKCLSTQVQVMRNFLDFCSSTPSPTT